MSSSNMSRRDFLWRTSMLAFSSFALLERTGGQDLKFVIAETSFGKIRGIDNHGIKTFKGIPYGTSTGGTNRFMPPADPASWTGVRDALEYGHSAPQSAPAVTHSAPTDPAQAPGPSIYAALGVSGTKSIGEGEDCLVLNVLGFANFSDFSPDFSASGDISMLDIVHALKWVKQG